MVAIADRVPVVAPVPGRDLLKGVFLDGVLAKLDISFWTGRRSLQSDDLGLERESIPNIFALGSKMIVPKKTVSLFGQIRSKADYILTQSSFPFPLSDARFIPYTALVNVMAWVEAEKVRFDAAVADFLTNYKSYHEALVAEYPAHKDALTRAFLPASRLTSKFGFRVALYSITIPQGMAAKVTKQSKATAQARRQAQAEQNAIAGLQQEYQVQMRAQMDEFLASSVKMLRERVNATVQSVAEKMEKGEVTGRGLKSLRQAIESFRNLNFMGDTAVETALFNLDQAMPESAGDLSEGSVIGPFAQALDAVGQTIKGNRISRVVERYGRKMMLEG